MKVFHPNAKATNKTCRRGRLHSSIHFRELKFIAKVLPTDSTWASYANLRVSRRPPIPSMTFSGIIDENFDHLIVPSRKSKATRHLHHPVALSAELSATLGLNFLGKLHLQSQDLPT